jgi:hypothetical protein
MLVLLFLLIDSPIIITEVMSNVKGSESGAGSPGDRNEFVEIYNLSADTIDLYPHYFIHGIYKFRYYRWLCSTL